MEQVKFEDGQSLDIVSENIDRLRAIFPEAFSEGGVNFETLRQLLGDAAVLDEGEEKYGMNWHGKKKARQIALVPSTGTLLPCPEESVDWDTTQNLFIEGDNLEVLKLLQKSYPNKIKMIYIDPPYNTGKDFVYSDNFQNNIKNYLEFSGQIDAGNKVSSNVEAGGRLHTDWMNMIYPRLKVARSLLRHDGVIFISIDDAELANLRVICDELFGPENFCGVIKRRAARKTAFLSKRMTDMCDYVVAYVKSELAAPLTSGQVSDGTRPVLNAGNSIGTRILRAGADAKCDDGIYEAGTYGARSLKFDFLDQLIVSDGKVVSDVRVLGPWRINQDVLDKSLFVTRNVGLRRTMLPEELNKAKLLNDLLDEKGCYNEVGSEEVNNLLAPGVFSNPKPRGLIEHLLNAAAVSEDDIVLDFFAGSGTVGHSVMERNFSDNGARRFILVQLPEPLKDNNSEQKAAVDFCRTIGRPMNIAEITKERLRRASQKIETTNGGGLEGVGFRVFKLDSSNIKVWNPDLSDLEESLISQQEHIVDGRSDFDILYELLIKRGVDLATPIETREVDSKSIYSIGYGVIFACLDESISREQVEDIAEGILSWHKELLPSSETHVFFRDSAFRDDVSKTNMAAILEQNGISHVRSL